MEQREKLTWMLSLLMDPQNAFVPTTAADYLLEHGVVALPCRCRECEYYDRGRDSCGRQVCMRTHFNGFCDFAKRKDDDE